MKYLREKDKKKKSPLVLLLVLVVVLLAAVLVLLLLLPGKTGGEPKNTEPSLQESAMQQEETAPQQTETLPDQAQTAETEEMDTSADPYVETPYCRLYYPKKWEGALRADTLQTQTDYQVAFLGSVGGNEEWLFTVYFGEVNEYAFSVGTVTTESGETVNVSAELSDFMPDDTWRQEDIDTMCEMQESLNYLLERLKEDLA